jgi:hypothetical protein
MAITQLAPLDETVKIPEAVKRAAAFAEAHYAKSADVPVQPQPVQQPTQNPGQQPTQNPDQPINIVAVPAPPVVEGSRPLLTEPVPEVQPVSLPQPVSTPAETSSQPDNWEHRYLSMKGRYDQSQQIMGGMQEQMTEMGQQLQRLVGQQNQQRQEPPKPIKVITPEDEKTYGPELIDLARRAAREEMQPQIEQARQESQRSSQRTQGLAEQEVRNQLDVQLPNWREINTSPEFLQWLSLRDLYSGSVRRALLNQAFQAASAPRVLAFFKGYLAEAQATGQLPAQQTTATTPVPPRQAAVSLDTLVSPGRAQPAPGSDGQPPEAPIFTHRQIREFYSHAGIARYAGRQADRVADEKLIFEAQAAGRVR